MNSANTPSSSSSSSPSDRPLDAFETALLGELQAVAAAQPVTAQPRRRRTVWAASGTAFAAALGAFGVATLMPNPAFSVSERNGELTVKVNRLEGAANLERELAKHGVRADIDFLKPGMKCQEGRYVEAPERVDMGISVGGEDFEVWLGDGAVGKDQTFVLWASVQRYENGHGASVEFEVANGPVKPCQPTVNSDWTERTDPDMGAPIPE